MPRILTAVLLVVALLGAGAYWLAQEDETAIQASVSVAEAMGGGDTTGYARADRVRDFVFPADHGPHPGFKTEWWYFTGNLQAEGGRRFGYQYTLFRVALAPPDTVAVRRVSLPADTGASWRADQFYMAHFTVSDVQREQMADYERFSRGAAGLAGAQADPLRLWLEDWTVTSAGPEPFPMHIRAAEDGTAIDLIVEPAKPYVLQGDRGLSPKGPGAGNASYYYSFTRLRTTGTVVVQRDTFAVEGASWMDREWSTSALAEGQEGWDWFALQLDDGTDLMYYQIRETDGSPSRFSEGVLVGPEGAKTSLARDEVQLEVLDRWASPRGGTYPSSWRLRVPGEDVELTVTPFFEDQELEASVRYWEGAVRIEGTRGGRSVEGTGYVELTGYGDAASPVGS